MTSHLLRARLVAWRRAERDMTGLADDVRRCLPDPEHAACDALLDRLDRIDAHLDTIRSLAQEIELDLRVDERGAA